MCRLLRSEGFSVASAGSTVEALAFVDESIHLVISDLRLGNENGLNLLRDIRAQHSALPVIVVTAYGDIATAVQAIKMGAFDFLTKPLEPPKLLALIREKLSKKPAQERDEGFGSFNGMIGSSAVMQSVYLRIQRASEVNCNVLITGETGTGKELVASALHRLSSRSTKPFIACNVSAIPEGLVESELFGVVKGAYTDAFRDREGVLAAANSGTLFLDEVGELPKCVQPKLLRVLEGSPFTPVGSRTECRIDVRFVFATHRDLRAMVEQDRFRSDLWHRMSVLSIELPALRDRREDIPQLFETFLREFCKLHGREEPSVSKDLSEFVEAYDWPGNVRQLRNAIESMVVMQRGSELGTKDLSPFLRSESSRVPILYHQESGLRSSEQKIILQTLKRHSGNRTTAAHELGISVRTLQRKLRRWENAD
jgi:DNA-binding NtrC family response regulator